MIIILNAHRLFNGDIEWYVTIFCHILFFIYLLIDKFKNYDKTKISDKSILAMIIVIFIIDAVLYWPLVYNMLYFFKNTDKSILAILYILSQLFITIPLLYYVSVRSYYYKSDKIEGDNIYFCLKKANTNRYILLSLIGAPFGSISVYAKNNLYGFKWSKDYFLKRRVSQKALQQTYIIFDTGIKCTDKHIESLNDIIGTTAKIKYLQVRFKCVYVLKDFLNILGKEYTPVFLEFIPSLFVKKIMGVKNG